MKHLISASLFCAMFGFSAVDSTANTLAVDQTIEITCDSEDDGVVRKHVRVSELRGDAIDLGVMPGNYQLRLSADLEIGADRTRPGAVKGSAEICAFNTVYDAAIGCAHARPVTILPNEPLRMMLFALGQMDPEGIHCQVSLLNPYHDTQPAITK